MLPVVMVDANDQASNRGLAKPVVVGLALNQPCIRILIAEDNFENSLLLSSLLTQTGFDTRVVNNGEEAINFFKQWHPDFIWMDMRMPIMDGYQATKTIRQLPGGDKVKIIALTANAFDDQREDILAAGCDEVLRKPFQKHEIFEAIGEQLGVRYRYEQAVAKAGNESILIGIDDVASIPEALRETLKIAAASLSSDEFAAALSQLDERHSALALRFSALAQKFRFDLILKYLNQAEASDEVVG